MSEMSLWALEKYKRGKWEIFGYGNVAHGDAELTLAYWRAKRPRTKFRLRYYFPK